MMYRLPQCRIDSSSPERIMFLIFVRPNPESLQSWVIVTVTGTTSRGVIPGSPVERGLYRLRPRHQGRVRLRRFGRARGAMFADTPARLRPRESAPDQ